MNLTGRPLRIEYSIVVTIRSIEKVGDTWRVRLDDGAILDFGNIRPAWNQGDEVQVIYRRKESDAQ